MRDFRNLAAQRRIANRLQAETPKASVIQEIQEDFMCVLKEETTMDNEDVIEEYDNITQCYTTPQSNFPGKLMEQRQKERGEQLEKYEGFAKTCNEEKDDAKKGSY